jgi:glutamate formiminotransferase/formiminotetrahydrofolate cyclodeaminase
MLDIVECVPNFSEGRDPQVIQQISAAIAAVEGVKLLSVEPGAATNRTVVTFIGNKKAIVTAAFAAIAKAAELIDMRQHHGEHPRLGATDVCPLIPVQGVTEEECVQLAHELARRVGEELHIPVYLYEKAAQRPERRNLADIRAGEYEGLPAKLQDPLWQPDYGPVTFNAKTGATVIGVRDFLIAYNVNLNTRDRKLAHEIALLIREKGRAKRDENGAILRNEQGEPLYEPGIFKATKAVGWYIEEYQMAQVSINLTNYRVAPLHAVFEEVRRLAEERGLRVTGSEIVGLVPLEAMLMAGRYFLAKQGKSTGVPEKELVRIAVQSLGLNEVTPFDPLKKIIEYQIQEFAKPLVNLSLRDFADELSTDSPAPGGGSVAALAGTLAAALTAMVANLTHGKKGYERHYKRMNAVAEQAQYLKDSLLRAVDRDTAAFNAVMNCFRLPKKTPEEQANRQAALQAATIQAAAVPLEVMQNVAKLLDLIAIVARYGNINSVSDAGVAALAAETAIQGAYLNVKINLKNLEATPEVEQMLYTAAQISQSVKRRVKGILRQVERRMN